VALTRRYALSGMCVRLARERTGRPTGYHFLGWGPRATGAGPGWNMAHDMFGRCGHCGGMLRLWPEDSVQCSCGRLAMDVDAGRFGSSDGDATIASTTMESSASGIQR
jgi:hypothetical protein